MGKAGVVPGGSLPEKEKCNQLREPGKTGAAKDGQF